MEVKQYSAKVRVWGGVSAQGHTRLLIYKDDLTGPKYLALLKKAKPDFDKIFGSGNRSWTFVHDGASPHKARMTNEWLEQNVPNYIESGPHGEWPANSPDLNPIEQVGIHEGETGEKQTVDSCAQAQNPADLGEC